MKVFDDVLKFTKQNAPTIFSGIAIAGVITTIFCVRHAAKEEKDILDAAKKELEGEITEEEEKELKRSAAIEVAKCYIPVALSVCVTTASIVMANKSAKKREMAAAAAYELSREALAAYKDKVKEIAGPKKAEAVKDAINIQKVKNNPPKDGMVIITGAGDYLCLDEISGRYFKSDINKIQKAINDQNQQIMSEMWVSLNEFYDKIGLPHISIGDDLGWSVDNMMELTPTYVSGEEGSENEGVPCMVMAFRDGPVPSFRY